MNATLVDYNKGKRTFKLDLDSGEELLSTLIKFSQDQGLLTTSIVGEGELSNVVVGFSSKSRKAKKDVEEISNMEIVALNGKLKVEEKALRVQMKVMGIDENGQTCGGHIIKAFPGDSLELLVKEIPVYSS